MPLNKKKAALTEIAARLVATNDLWAEKLCLYRNQGCEELTNLNLNYVGLLCSALDLDMAAVRALAVELIDMVRHEAKPKSCGCAICPVQCGEEPIESEGGSPD